jgi:hypothetical protein
LETTGVDPAVGFCEPCAMLLCQYGDDLRG